MINVLFVCLGNICRSPMAEAVFRNLVVTEGFADKFRIDSAGTADWHQGNSPHEGTIEILNRYEISSENIFARQFLPTDLTEFNYVIAMDDMNVEDLEIFIDNESTAFVGKLCDFIKNSRYENVPDPYYTGDFDETYELILAGCRGLFDFIIEKGT